MIPIGWLPLFCANNSMTSPAAPCWPRISAWNSLTILVGDWLIHSIPLYLCTYHCTNRLRGVQWFLIKPSNELSPGVVRRFSSCSALTPTLSLLLERNREKSRVSCTLCKKKHKIIIPGSKALPDALAKAQFPNKNSTRTFTASSKATP